MSILERLRQEHAEVANLLDGVLASPDPAERRRLFEQAAPALLAHAQAEDAVLYKPLMASGGVARTLMFYAEDEHQIIGGFVRGLRRRENTEGVEWMRLCEMLRNALNHHVGLEETEAFEQARALLSPAELDRMEQEYLAAKGAFVDRPPILPSARS